MTRLTLICFLIYNLSGASYSQSSFDVGHFVFESALSGEQTKQKLEKQAENLAILPGRDFLANRILDNWSRQIVALKKGIEKFRDRVSLNSLNQFLSELYSELWELIDNRPNSVSKNDDETELRVTNLKPGQLEPSKDSTPLNAPGMLSAPKSEPTPEAVAAAFPDIFCNDCVIGEKLGSGSSSTAFLVTNRSGRMVAKFTNLTDATESERTSARQEIQCHSACDHFAVIEFINATISADGNLVLILLEFADGGDLKRQLEARSRKGKYLSEFQVRYLFYVITLGVGHMHSQNMLHGDIKPANILVERCGILKLADLGFAQRFERDVSNNVTTLNRGTPMYMAPEILHREACSSKADIWALGVVLYELMVLEPPFTGSTMYDLYNSIVGGVNAAFGSSYSPELNKLVRGLLSFDPDVRPCAKDILLTPYMKETRQALEQVVQESVLISENERERILSTLKSLEAEQVGQFPRELGTGRQVIHRGRVRYQKQLCTLLLTPDMMRLIQFGENSTILKSIQPAEVVSASCRDAMFFINCSVAGLLFFQVETAKEASDWVTTINSWMQPQPS